MTKCWWCSKVRARIRLIGPGKPVGIDPRFDHTYDVAQGDVVLFPQGWAHSVEDKDPENPVKVLVIFNNQDFKAVEDEFETAKMHLGENA